MREQHNPNAQPAQAGPGPGPAGETNAPRTGSVLRIVAGLHAGATRILTDQEMLVVGSGDDCDIVLADTGVAMHHALITLVNGAYTLRALDAPLRIDGKPLHPGDPAQLRPMQRIDLGEAAIALGSADESAWSALFPSVASEAGKSRSKRFIRRMPVLAAATVLVLAIAAVLVAMLPRSGPQVDAQAFLRSMIPQHHIMQGKASTDANGIPTLTGTVEDDQTRSDIEQQLKEAGIVATVSLRTGDGMARDVAEIFRAQGRSMQTRYLGNGQVEINGAIDKDTLQRVMDSSAIKDIGVAKFVAGTQLTSTAPLPSSGPVEQQAAAEPSVDIVSVVRGKEPYVVDVNGVQYPVGDRVPGHGTLIVIGKQVWVQADNGEIKVLRPVTAAELAARAAPPDGGVAQAAVAGSQPASQAEQAGEAGKANDAKAGTESKDKPAQGQQRPVTKGESQNL